MVTNRDRFMATLNGEPRDRVPLFPLLMFLAADRAGMTYREYATNGAALAEADYAEFALPYEQQTCRAIHDAVGLVKLHVCGNTTHLLARMVTAGADLFNVDHMVPLEKARDVYAAHDSCFKGNLDPVDQVMRATPEQCRQAAHACIALAEGTRYMLSAGCEIPAETPDTVSRAFCEAPKTYCCNED